jgi:hypothetical protein
LWERYWYSAERRHRLTYIVASFEDVADDQNDREAKSLSTAAAKGDTGDKSVLVHTIDTASPGPLRLADHPHSRPRCDLKSFRNNIGWVIEIADEGWPSSSQPDGLTAAMAFWRRTEVTEHSMRHVIVANEVAGAVIVERQLRHVIH